MDVLIIGKRSFSRNETPVVVYCGQSRNEGFAAARERLAELPFMFFVNPEPYHRITQTTAAATAPAVAPTPEPPPPAAPPEAASLEEAPAVPEPTPEPVKPVDKPKPKKK